MKLDFCCVGAPKSGTTTLYEWLRSHPELCLPRDKESPIFHHPVASAAEIEGFLQTAFAHGAPNQKYGKITPHYIASETAARQLSQHSPNARILVLVRNPVDRAASHHAMLTRRGSETRSLEEALREQLARERLSPGGLRSPMPASDGYLAWGRWASLVRSWERMFNSVLVVPLWALNREPSATLAQITEFLGVSNVPVQRLDVVHNSGHVDAGALYRMAHFLNRTPARHFWLRLPPAMRRQLSFHLETRGRSSSLAAPSAPLLSAEFRAELNEFFAPDFELMANLGWGTEVIGV